MGSKLRERVQNHPVESFFLLATALSYATLFPAIYLIPRDAGLGGIAVYLVSRIGVFSPVIAAIAVTRIVRPGVATAMFGRRLAVFVPVFLVAALVHGLQLSRTAPPGANLIGLFVVLSPVALLPAWVITSAVSGSVGLRELLGTLVRPRGRLVYYLVALLTFPAVHVAGVVITNLRSGRPWLPAFGGSATPAVTFAIEFISVLLFTGGLNEESGWRGFAQRRLQARFSPLAANLVLWLCLLVWHVPNDLQQYRNGGYVTVRLLLYPCITVLFGWVYNRTGGSILAPALFHASMNAMNPLMGILPITTAGNLILIAFTALAVLSDRMWRRLPGGHPAVYPEDATRA